MKPDKDNDLIYLGSGIMISVSISLIVAMVINITLLGMNELYYLFIFPIGLFMGIGLLPFKIKDK